MSRYAAAHANPQGAGDARPTALQIVKDEGMENKLIGKVAVITGISSGIGIETARALAATGATLYLTARDVSKAETALEDFFDTTRMTLVELDLASLASVRAAADKILAKEDKINLLINNAGVMAVQDRQLTEDGHELQFGTNHLAHFLLFQLLKPALLAGSSKDFQSRVVNVASTAHQLQALNAFDNYNWANGGYDPWLAYGQSKTANIYTANEIERRYGSRGLHATSLHPGGIATALSRHMPQEQLAGMLSNDALVRVLKTPEQGAATTTWAAIGKEWEGKGGKYLNNCTVAEGINEVADFQGPGLAKHTYDEAEEGRLWTDSLRLVGLVQESDE